MNTSYNMKLTSNVLLISLVLIKLVNGGPEEKEGVKYANKCEGKTFKLEILPMSSHLNCDLPLCI